MIPLMWKTKTTRSIRTGNDDPTDVENKDDKKYKNW